MLPVGVGDEIGNGGVLEMLPVDSPLRLDEHTGGEKLFMLRPKLLLGDAQLLVRLVEIARFNAYVTGGSPSPEFLEAP